MNRKLIALPSYPLTVLRKQSYSIFQVQQCIEFLIEEALRMGAHPDDRDSVTDMTFLMFTCKAGAAGVGDGTRAAKVIQFFPSKQIVGIPK